MGASTNTFKNTGCWSTHTNVGRCSFYRTSVMKFLTVALVMRKRDSCVTVSTSGELFIIVLTLARGKFAPPRFAMITFWYWYNQKSPDNIWYRKWTFCLQFLNLMLRLIIFYCSIESPAASRHPAKKSGNNKDGTFSSRNYKTFLFKAWSKDSKF